MYTFSSRVRYSELNEQGQLSITSIINYLQDCSTLQSEDIGRGVSFLKQQQRAWWLSSWQIIVDRYPLLGESITVETWPYDFRGFYGYRNFTIRDQAGDYLVRANSVWFFFDTEAGRPVKIQHDDISGYGIKEVRLTMKYAPRKIIVSDNQIKGEPMIVKPHHLDTNHHVNNAQYVEMARSLIANDFIIGEVRVEYKKAAYDKAIIIPYIEANQESHTVSLCDLNNDPYAIVWMKRKD